ncbi:MAG: MBL fold metallo-hydrolase [Bacteroidia bacterium]|jgi:phosphoribosyl 1,2-cyclic phosphate phosphodiesterase|tara:strand:- start:38728 stop:39489 length:762 start_codon:yes stop_codon:yes gene_type:complete
MKITFLGTGTSQGVPIIACNCTVCQSIDSKDKRLRSSVLVEAENTTFVIDTGPDFRYQMLREGTMKLDAVVFTHEHKDHIAGFDDIRGFNWKTQKPMEVYATPNVEIALKRDFHYAFGEKRYPGVPSLNLHVIENKPFFVGDLEVMPIEVLHYKLPVFGYRVRDFSYVTDVNFISNEEKQKLKGSKVLVISALKQSEHISHYSLEQAIAVAKEIGAEQTYFTHMSHQMGLHSEVDAQLPDGMNLAYDRLVLEL